MAKAACLKTVNMAPRDAPGYWFVENPRNEYDLLRAGVTARSYSNFAEKFCERFSPRRTKQPNAIFGGKKLYPRDFMSLSLSLSGKSTEICSHARFPM